MNLRELLASLEAAGIRLTARGDKLRYSCPPGALTDDFAHPGQGDPPSQLVAVLDARWDMPHLFRDAVVAFSLWSSGLWRVPSASDPGPSGGVAEPGASGGAGPADGVRRSQGIDSWHKGSH